MWDHATEEHFFKAVNKNGPLPVNRPELGPCWIWAGQTTWKEGEYGRFRMGNKSLRAYRFSYENLRGPIPKQLQLDHLCLRKQCVNPAHLEPVTLRENILRANSMVAENARKTHCHKGHPFDEGNTSISFQVGRLPHRVCKACRRVREKEKRVRAAARRLAAQPEQQKETK